MGKLGDAAKAARQRNSEPAPKARDYWAIPKVCQRATYCWHGWLVLESGWHALTIGKGVGKVISSQSTPFPMVRDVPPVRKSVNVLPIVGEMAGITLGARARLQ